jgi:YebC/PmpR family DNA-binding regulatory protein
MAGHSKYKNIMYRKGAQDKKRSAMFSKLSREITVAAKMGAPDPDMNARLRAAVNAAKAQSMPKDNIQRSIDKASASDAENYEDIRYEGFGPGGVSLVVEALTDNRNRTGADVRHALSKSGGNLGEPGSVAYLFDKQGVILVDAERYGEDDLIVAIDAGAEDIARDDDVYEIVTAPGDLGAVRDALAAAGIDVESADVSQRPKSRVPVDEADAGRLMKLIDTLEESDDVSAVHANFDVDAAVLERIAG